MHERSKLIIDLTKYIDDMSPTGEVKPLTILQETTKIVSPKTSKKETEETMEEQSRPSQLLQTRYTEDLRGEVQKKGEPAKIIPGDLDESLQSLSGKQLVDQVVNTITAQGFDKGRLGKQFIVEWSEKEVKTPEDYAKLWRKLWDTFPGRPGDLPSSGHGRALEFLSREIYKRATKLQGIIEEKITVYRSIGEKKRSGNY